MFSKCRFVLKYEKTASADVKRGILLMQIAIFRFSNALTLVAAQSCLEDYCKEYFDVLDHLPVRMMFAISITDDVAVSFAVV